ncbi:hypothetical protein PL9631_970004 [Planktothrix paucivesiculata PCC 9631]|uniref:Uncharacterized protein n=1 Tax=Planktothrix paucivesiculata PCC 9631 TaxID=671071 RepID=A0A7Z9E5J9_9CYAN|nr:hypothetical protein PL9631_970004 [Planktothrix paucivesiculata PCC 9631]
METSLSTLPLTDLKLSLTVGYIQSLTFDLGFGAPIAQLRWSENPTSVPPKSVTR